MFDFDTDLSAFGTAQARTSTSNRVDPKAKFVQMGERTLEQLAAGERDGHWFRTQSNGTVIVTLRNGNRLLNKDKPQFVCKDVAGATGYIKAAMAACEAGKLDKVFELQYRRF